MPTTRRAAALANAEKAQRTCEKCKNPNHVAEMIACDRCHRWCHRTCVDEAEIFDNRKWTCEDCILTTTFSSASISGRTSSTSRSTRIQLQLMRLEEEKKAQEKLILEQQEQERLLQEKTMAAKAELDKKYLDEKYALLIAEAEDDESGSVRSRRSRVSRISRVSQTSKVQEWIQEVDEAAGRNPVSDSDEPQNVDEAAGGNSVPDKDEVPNPGAQAKYTGTTPKMPTIPEDVGNKKSTPKPANESSIPGTNTPVTSSTPIQPMELIPKVTVPNPPLLKQPEQSRPILQKLVPRPIIPKSAFPDPLQLNPPSTHVPVSLPPRREPPLPLPQPRVEQPTSSDPELPREPPSKPTQQPKDVPRSGVPSLLPQPLLPRPTVPEQSVPPASSNPPLSKPTHMPSMPRLSRGDPLMPEKSGIQPPPAPSNPPLSLPTRMPQIPRSSRGDPSIPEKSGIQPPPAPPKSSIPPSFVPFEPYRSHTPQIPRSSLGNPLARPSAPPPPALQEPLPYVPLLPHPPEPQRQRPRATDNQPMSSYPSYEQQQMMQQLQNQQAMWGQFQQQLSARQVVPKELPVFSGNPEEWPLFICSYRNSTDMCGYSEAENLMRLQRCLKGRALEAVRSNLLLPSSVPQVLETLETLFGSPDRLVQSLLNKVRSVPTPKAERLETLVNFGLVVQNLVGHLKAANQQAHLTNPTLLQELVDKLPPHIRLDWALFKKRAGTVDLGNFCDYMSTITAAASDVAHYSDFDGARMCRNERQKKVFVNAHAPEDSRKFEQQGKKPDNQVRPCYICQSVKHRIKDCYKFKSLSLGDRLKAVDQHQLCSSCLVPHGRWPCKSTRVCGIDGCTVKHHPTLHPHQSTASKPVPAERSRARANSDAVVSIHRQMQSSTIFRIIPVVLYGTNVQVHTFAFLDEGSSLTLIDKEMADLLELEGELQPLCLTWTANVTRREADSRQVSLQIAGGENDRKFSLANVRTVARLDLPVQTLQYDELSHRYPYLSGLPVKSYDQAVPRILIGLDNLKLSVPLKKREGRFNGPVAAKTRLGWTVFGSIGDSKVDSFSPIFHICEKIEEDSLHELVKSYFATEILGVAVSSGPEAEEDRRAKEILQRTTVKRTDGHYETGLLWRYDEVELPSSYAMAERRLICLERKLRAHPELQASLEKQISEYQAKGYAHKATPKELEESDSKRIWYLPLGVVTSPRKPGKVRIIWDAAAKAHGLSLNDVLLKGPDLLTSLLKVLCHFRQRQVAVAGDIREMFHQMKIREEDLQALRFLFRKDPSLKPEVFVMDVAIFGATCSPCSANFVKNTNAMEWKHKFPEAAAAIVENHYVDDYLDSRDTEEEMGKLAAEVRMVQSKAGFELRNWRSNLVNVLRFLGEDTTDLRKDFTADKACQVERVLGMAWLPDEDVHCVFVYSVKLPQDLERIGTAEATQTKRGILRFVMSVFDPLGLISHLLIHGKMIIQDLWRSQVGWDDPIPTEVHGNWKRWIEQFTQLHEVQIPRCYFPGYDPNSFQTLQLHVFVDASESAFACVAYFRMMDRGQPRCALIASKAKVAPLKPLSIPRLELQAAVIGSRLAKSVAEYHSLPVNRRFFWTDSKTVLSWIRSDARKYRQYVAVRIGEILEETTMEEWRWVPTKLNVADEATKWGKGPTLHPGSRWFTGPEFLYQQEDEWPQQQVQSIDTEEELRAIHVHRVEVTRTCIDPERFSKWERMLRATSYVYSFVDRYVELGKHGAMQIQRELKQEDFIRAERALWQLAQADVYAEELVVLKKSNESDGSRVPRLEKNSPIRKLSPFLDEFGVMRMEGRIEASPLASYEAKFPVILPKNHRVTNLLVDWYHRKLGHHNSETVVNEIRQRFHISALRTVVRTVAKRCQWCVVYKANPEVPRMAPLPQARVTPFVRPFSRVGIDYFGPYMIKIGRSQVKRWVALFTCLVIRAVHLEVTASMSTESCKLALRRFIARRGAPAEIYTDHGTNFVGASRELSGQVAAMNRELSETFTNTNTRWFFIPPSSPHMGGAWERMVRAVKGAMESINCSRAPSEEVFQTVLCEAESMVNSRPLTYMPLETSDQEALTPNHFILLSSNGVKQTEKAPTTEGEALRNGWNLCRYLLDQFWIRWSREYLPVVTMRTKWHEDVKPVQEGDAVFIVGEAIRNRWTRGKVLKVIPGKDGRIRQADVQTSTGVLRRPVAKLAVLRILPTGNPAEPEQNYGEGNVAGDVTTVSGTE